jgi:hypothetical protein
LIIPETPRIILISSGMPAEPACKRIADLTDFAGILEVGADSEANSRAADCSVGSLGVKEDAQFLIGHSA